MVGEENASFRILVTEIEHITKQKQQKIKKTSRYGCHQRSFDDVQTETNAVLGTEVGFSRRDSVVAY